MHKLILAILLLSSTAFGFDHNPIAASVSQRLQDGDSRALAAEALTEMVNLASDALDRRGYHTDALEIRDEWEGHYALVVAGVLEDVGDHEPLSWWISLWYAALSAELGDQYMELSHLKDIWVMNLVIPVTFNPHQESEWCAEQLHMHPQDTCQAEYRRHFAGTKYVRHDPYATTALHHGFAGVVSYWLTWGSCQAATWGMGWFVICSPAGSLAEIIVEKTVAVHASDLIWRSRETFL